VPDQLISQMPKRHITGDLPAPVQREMATIARGIPPYLFQPKTDRDRKTEKSKIKNCTQDNRQPVCLIMLILTVQGNQQSWGS